ncbi:lipid A export permease/ATP-binding protein MsbA [Dasania marina]|uniref:lipid A export permease/ATP-binding protein MsbA n=1 Tax=Dasania marina TaxID=471499 RepID=UPI00037CA66D|nr:lipid A export permease/ATP-binding protein MsbA [Dasania marina]
MSKNNDGDLTAYLRLLRYVTEYWFVFSLSIIGFMIFSASQIAMADLMGFIVDSLNGSLAKNSGGIVASLVLDMAGADILPNQARNWIVGSIILLGMLRGVGFFFGNYYITYISRHLIHKMRCNIFDHMLLVPSKEYDGQSSGFLISKIIFNVEQVTKAVTSSLKVIIREGLFSAGLVAYLFYVNWQLSLFLFLALPLVALLVTWVGKRFRKISEKIQVSMGEVTQVTSESISAYKEVRIFGGTETERKKFQKASNKNLDQSVKMGFYNAISPPVIQQPVTLVLAFLVWVGLGLSGEMSAGTFVAYLTAAMLLPKPIRQLSEVFSDVQKGLAAATDVFGFLDSQVEKDEGTFQADTVSGAIEFKHINFGYNEENGHVLHDINLTIKPGQTVALVGSSGSGKSSLASLITRFYDYSEGCICIDGKPITEYSLENLRSHIAVVTQSVTLFNDSIRNNIAYGAMADASDDDIHAAVAAAHAQDFIANLPQGLDTITGEDGVMLSGGQRQRLAIARALLKDAPILILDEATSALDNQSERHIQDALEAVMESRTTLVIAHRLSTIENADVIVVMEQGRIVEQGDHPSLIALDGRYAALHKNQFNDS